MPEYSVTWEINVVAESPGEAALAARSMQLPGTLATVFTVVDKHHHHVKIDVQNLRHTQIIVAGNPVDGLRFIGPFDADHEISEDDTRNLDEWWLAALDAPMP